MEQILVQTLHGLVNGMVLAIVASGLTLIFGIMDIVNFAHGDLLMLGAFVGASVLGMTGNYWLALATAATIACAIPILGWIVCAILGLAAAIGGVAGMMVAPIVYLDPNMMGGIQLYAFAAATVGGFTSPLGAVVGGLLVGVTENLVGTYVSFIGTELKLTVALAMIIIVLLVRPTGLFGRTTVRRV